MAISAAINLYVHNKKNYPDLPKITATIDLAIGSVFLVIALLGIFKVISMPSITSYSLAGVGGAYLLTTAIYLGIYFKRHSCNPIAPTSKLNVSESEVTLFPDMSDSVTD